MQILSTESLPAMNERLPREMPNDICLMTKDKSGFLASLSGTHPDLRAATAY